MNGLLESKMAYILGAILGALAEGVVIYVDKGTTPSVLGWAALGLIAVWQGTLAWKAFVTPPSN